jgi:hypothetical protein
MEIKMMYHQKMILAVKSNGKILREFKDVVKLPFGSEYSLLIKNIHNKRAEVSVEIDGQDVLNGRSMIVNGNSETELTRFVNDLSSGNTFKFIERTASIEQHRGIKIDDGLIRITFKYEVDKGYIAPQAPTTNWPNSPSHWQINQIRTRGISSQTLDSSSVTKGIQGSSTLNVHATIDWMESDLERCIMGNNSAMYNASVMNGACAAVSDIGITVPGSISNQPFREVLGFSTELEEHVMILRLSGVIGEQLVVQPITVKTKPKCITCGHQNKSTSKFCTECGTSLNIF